MLAISFGLFEENDSGDWGSLFHRWSFLPRQMNSDIQCPMAEAQCQTARCMKREYEFRLLTGDRDEIASVATSRPTYS